MTEKYKRLSGFTFISSVTCERYIGKLADSFLESTIKKHKSNTVYSISSNLDEATVQKLIQYDSDIRGEDTSYFFTTWLDYSQINASNPDQCIYIVCAKNQRNQVVGYGNILKCRVGRRVGPVMAENFEIFLTILKELINYKFIDEENQSNEDISLNIPSTNSIAIEFAKEANLKLLLSLDRSFTKQIVDFQFDKVFCFAGHIGVPE